jgi:hypothetical protein
MLEPESSRAAIIQINSFPIKHSLLLTIYLFHVKEFHCFEVGCS